MIDDIFNSLENYNTTSSLTLHPVHKIIGTLQKICVQNIPQHQAEIQFLIESLSNYTAEMQATLKEQENRIVELETLVITDPVTAILNRRGFDMMLNKVLASARRYNEEGLVGVIDIDNFKSINDTYGHDAGDVILKYVSEFMTERLRQTDIIARMGGDEFAFIMTRADAEQATARIKQISAQLNRSSVLYYDEIIPVHASFGYVPYCGSSTATDILASADRIMYHEKSKHKVSVSDYLNRIFATKEQKQD